MPASAHGTNAASAEMAGLETVQLKTNNIGGIDMDNFKKEVLPLLCNCMPFGKHLVWQLIVALPP